MSSKKNKKSPKTPNISNEETQSSNQSITIGNQEDTTYPNEQRQNRNHPSKHKINAIAWFTFFLVLVGGIQAYWMYHAVSDSRATQRAFISVNHFDTEILGDVLVISPRWENSGTTPTKGMFSHSNMAIFDSKASIDDYPFPDVDEDGKPSKDKNEKKVPFYVGPKGYVNGGASRVPIKTVEAASKGQVKIFVYGWADYNDIFKRTPRHRTEYCMELVITNFEIKNGRLEIKSLATFWKSHNCTDDDCK